MLLDLFKEFQVTNPGLVRMMKDCDHHFSPVDLNDWHLESDVWAHTCLVYKKLMELDLPESEEYETIAGFLLYHAERLPTKGDQIQVDELLFHVLKVEGTRVELLKVKILAPS